MDEERYPALPWQGWKIVKRLGRGGYGSVYLAQRNSAGVMEDAAVKVISFPKNEEDIEADFTDGYDLVSVRNKYKNMLHRYVDEYQIMLAFKGQTNIVSCDDFEAKPHKDGIGWDVFIRMELLTPLTTLIKQYAGIIPEEMVIKVGKDICSALMLCDSKNIVHRDIKGRESMRNRKVKIFALVMAGCLCLSGLTGCGGGIKMTTDDTSSKSDSGLMGSAKKEADKSDDSEADSADKEDKISDDMIGRYVSQGYENPSFGFAINLPDTYTLENRNNVALNDADIVESSNSEGTYDYLKSLISLGSAVVFSAEDGNTYIELNIQNAAVLDKTAKWDEEKNIAENSVMTEEDAKKLMGEDAQVTEFQNNVEEITFLGEKHYAAQYTFKNYDVSYYGVTVFLVNEQDSQYMLAVNIIGVDLNVVDQADQFFSVYTE